MHKFDALAWKQAHRQASEREYVCENGLVLTVRKVRLESLIERGQIPDPLMPAIARFVGWEQEPDTMTPWERLQDRAAVYDVVTAAAVVDPAVSMEPVVDDEPVIYVKDIPFDDRFAVYTWAQEALPELASFPGPQRRNGARPARGRQRLPRETEPVDAGELDRLPDRSRDPQSEPGGSAADEAADERDDATNERREAVDGGVA